MSTPNFLVIGAQKCGTTALYEYLRRHPDVFMAQPKELRYFSRELDRLGSIALNNRNIETWDEYLEYFKDPRQAMAIGEVSPSYLYYPGCARHIREALPDARLIAILREPVARACSEWWHHWRAGRRLPGDVAATMWAEDAAAPPRISEHLDLVRRGLYFQQLKPYFDAFPRAQIKVLLFDDLQADSLKVARELFDFLGLAPQQAAAPGQTIYNEGVTARMGLPMIGTRWLERLLDHSPATESRKRERRRLLRLRTRVAPERGGQLSRQRHTALARLFAEDVAQLEDLIGRDLSVWRGKP